MGGTGAGGRRARIGLCMLVLPGLVPALAQYERPKQELTAPEREAIQINRKLAGPRPTTRPPIYANHPAPSGGLGRISTIRASSSSATARYTRHPVNKGP